MNAWLKRCVFNLDLNRESVSEPDINSVYEQKLLLHHLRDAISSSSVLLNQCGVRVRACGIFYFRYNGN